MYTFC